MIMMKNKTNKKTETVKRDIWQVIKQEILRQTGLEEDADIEAYAHFCTHADVQDGVIIWRDVQHEFYRFILENSSKAMKHLERVYNDAVGNHIRTRGKFGFDFTPQLKSHISLRAQKEFAKYYHKFIQMGLVEPPRTGKKEVYDEEAYQRLTGYNFLNDPIFYERIIDERGNSSGRRLRI